MDYVIGVDPGGHTGVAFGVRKGSRFQIRETSEVKMNHGDAYLGYEEDDGLPILGQNMVDFIKTFGSSSNRIVLVFEDFIGYPGRSAAGQSGRTGLSPVYVTGFLLGYIRGKTLRRNVKVVYQSAADAKHVVNDERMRRLGLWMKGQGPHIRDAIRHAELFCRREGLVYRDAEGRITSPSQRLKGVENRVE